MDDTHVDVPTALAVATTIAATLLPTHELGGHAVMALALGHSPIYVTSTFVSGSGSHDLLAERLVICAGGAINLVVFAIAMALLRLWPPRSGLGRYVLWTLGAVHGYNAFGYMMTSFVLKSGDFFAFARTFPNPTVPGVIVTALGAVGYLVLMPRFVRPHIAPLVGGADDRLRRLRLLALAPYFATVVLALASGALSPLPSFSLRNAFMSTVFGLIGLPLLARGKAFAEPSDTAAMSIARAWPWIAAAPISGIVFLAIFGPGFQIGKTEVPMKTMVVEEWHRSH